MSASRREYLLVFGFFFALAIAATWPLAASPTTTVVDPGDGRRAFWGLFALTWGIHSLGNNPLSYFDAKIFYPYPDALAFGDHLFGPALLMAPLQWALASPTFTYNVAVILSFVVAGAGAYFAARQITGSIPAGLVSGLLYSLSSFRMTNLGDLNVLALAGLPWILLVGHMYMETRRRRLIYLATAFAWLQAVSCTYSLWVLLLLPLPLLFMLLAPRFGKTRRGLWKQKFHFLVGVSGFAILYLPFLKPYLSHDLEQAMARAPADTGYAAAPGTLAALDQGFLISHFLRDGFPDVGLLHPGWLALLLIGVLIGAGLRRDAVIGRETLYYLTLAAVALAAGALFHLRFSALLSLALAVLAGLGTAQLGRFIGFVPRAGLLIVLVPLGVAIERLPGPATLHATIPREGPPAIYAWLADIDEDAVLAEFPVLPDQPWDSWRRARRQLFSTYHWKTLVDGEAPRIPPLTTTVRRRLAGFPDDRAIAQLRALHVDLAVVHLDEYEPDVRPVVEAELAGRSDLQLEADLGGARVYRLAPQGDDSR